MRSKADLYFFLFVIFLIGLSYLGVRMMNNITEETFEKFPLVKNNEAINLRIKASDEYKGTTLVHTIKGDSLSIMAYEWGPTSYNPLVEFLECGDSIFRKAYSDTLYLYKKKDGVVMEFQVQCFE